MNVILRRYTFTIQSPPSDSGYMRTWLIGSAGLCMGNFYKSLRVPIGIWNLHYAPNFWETYQHESPAWNYQQGSAVPIEQLNTVGVLWRLQVPIMKYDHGVSWIDCSPMILINPSELVILLFQLLSWDNSCWVGWFLSVLQKINVRVILSPQTVQTIYQRVTLSCMISITVDRFGSHFERFKL